VNVTFEKTFQKKSKNTNPRKIQVLKGPREREVFSVSRETLHFVVLGK
jgi:hypothetical protein